MCKKVQSFFILLIFCTQGLFAMSYDEDILNMYAKLSPRIVLMSSIKDELDSSLGICILHEETDDQAASTLHKKIINNYKDGLKGYTLRIKKVFYSNLEECRSTNMLFFFRTNEMQLKKSIEFSQENQILTISYDSKTLESGVDLSLFIGRKVVPYINVRSIKSKGIILENILFRISKIYNTQTKGESR